MVRHQRFGALAILPAARLLKRALL